MNEELCKELLCTTMTRYIEHGQVLERMSLLWEMIGTWFAPARWVAQWVAGERNCIRHCELGQR
jgi:hypothetical protein